METAPGQITNSALLWTELNFDTALGGSAQFSHTTGTSPVTVNADDDYLFFGTVFISSDAANDNQDRIVPLQGWQIDGSGGAIARGRGGAATQSLIVTSSAPDPIYVDDDLAGTPFATAIADADGGASIAPATMGLNAFATVAEALAAVSPTGTIIVNDGDYSGENVVLKDTITLQLTGNGAGTVTFTTLTSPVGPNIDLGAETLVINNTPQHAIDCPISGSGNLTKNGPGRLILRNTLSYTGTTTVNEGQLRGGYETVAAIQSTFDGDGPIVVNSPGIMEFNVGLGRTQTVTGVISGPANVQVQNNFDNGEVTFTGINTYLGTTIVNGVLYLNGSHSTGGNYQINNGGNLAGTGSTSSPVNVAAGGSLAPGVEGIGTLAIGGLTLNGTLAIDVDNTAGTAGTDWDQVAVTGAVTVSNGTLAVSQSATVEAGPGDIIIIANDAADAVSGPFASGDPFTADFLSSGTAGEVDYLAGDGNDVALTSVFASAIEAWRVVNFGSAANSGNGADLSDAGDSDGLNNLLEFAFGTDPNAVDPAGLAIDGSSNGTPIVDVDSSGAIVEINGVFTRRDDHGSPGSVEYIPQFSSDLENWVDGSDEPTLVTDSSEDAAYEVVEVPFPVLLADGKEPRYFRVVVNPVP